ncbi:MAG: YkvA family protein [Candidatus Binatia bacterium]
MKDGPWKEWAESLKEKTATLYLVARDPRVPLLPKLVVALVVAYALSPIDLIPDFIPIIGFLDDFVLLPLGIWLAVTLVSPEVWTECHALASRRASEIPGNRWAAAVIVIIWLLGILGFTLWAWQFARRIISP